MRYRSLRGTFDSFPSFLMTLQALPRKRRTLLVGVDGCGGSGKSTFARLLAETGPGITVVHMDDFYLPSALRLPGSPSGKPIGADFDWQRVQRQVLAPLTEDREARCQRYDWEADRLEERFCVVPPGGIVIVEGCYAIRREIREAYDCRVWVETPRQVRLTRGLERDGEEARDRWEKEWMVAEEIYIQRQNPAAAADLILDGAGA